MKIAISLIAAMLLAALPASARANQAGDAAITIVGKKAGPTPFINKLRLKVSDLSVLTRIKFAVVPKPGSVTRPLSANYSKAYLNGRGYVDPTTGGVTVPVFGLYDDYRNKVMLTYFFADGSSKTVGTMVPTAKYDDGGCPYDTPTIRQARTGTTELSYDFMFISSSCGSSSPTVIDTDGAVRWVGTASTDREAKGFFKNGVYMTDGTRLLRIELDGEVNVVADYGETEIVGFHHNIDRGKHGIITDVNTTSYIASVHMEVDRAGQVLKTWNLAAIIRDAMIAGGDDPSGFVREAKGQYDFGAYEDWAHNNAVAYRKSDDSIIISSRENFVICIDYQTSAIKWILGDTTKEWYQYPSLRNFALTVAPGGIAPVGQHAVSITKDDHLLLFDNGKSSGHHTPRGPDRSYSAVRKYQLDLAAKTATEVWTFVTNDSARSAFRSSVYEDAAENYLVTYAGAILPDGTKRARILGLAASGAKVFDYTYPSLDGATAYRSFPVHWEKLVFTKNQPVADSPTLLPPEIDAE